MPMKEKHYSAPDMDTVTLMQSAALMENLSGLPFGVWNYGNEDPENQYYYYDED